MEKEKARLPGKGGRAFCFAGMYNFLESDSPHSFDFYSVSLSPLMNLAWKGQKSWSGSM